MDSVEIEKVVRDVEVTECVDRVRREDAGTG